jgi:hypothetical protein
LRGDEGTSPDEIDETVLAIMRITGSHPAHPAPGDGGGKVERVARAIAKGCNLDPDAISPKAAEAGHTIPEWMFFTQAAHLAIAALRQPDTAGD